MKAVITCSDVIQAMEREKITVEAADLSEAFDKAKKKFARKYKTRVSCVHCTGVERLN